MKSMLSTNKNKVWSRNLKLYETGE